MYLKCHNATCRPRPASADTAGAAAAELAAGVAAVTGIASSIRPRLSDASCPLQEGKSAKYANLGRRQFQSASAPNDLEFKVQ